MKQAELARVLGIQPPNLSDIERGEYKDLPLETTRRLSDFFGVLIEDLFPPRGPGPHPSLPFGRATQAAAR